MMGRMMGPWSDLPEDILIVISERLTFLLDLKCFASVCGSWRRAAQENCSRIPNQPALLMLPYEEGTKTCKFFNICEKDVFKVHMPELSKKWCCGSSEGWLTTVDDDLNISLINPFSKVQVKLPPHPMFPDILASIEIPFTWKDPFILKATLSASPLSSDCIVMAIVSKRGSLSFCRVGDDKWTTLDLPSIRFEDIIWYDGKIYAVNYWRTAIVCDPGPPLKVEEIRLAGRRDGSFLTTINYLVESGGELLHIIRYLKKLDNSIEQERETEMNCLYYKTTEFDVFKLERWSQKTHRWIKLKSLGDHYLFLGGSHSLSFSVQDFSEYRANCIYFTDDYADGYFENIHGCHDMGVFNLEDGSVEPFYQNAPRMISPTFWISQNL